jgi:ATP-binding cassette subfamily B multidrug efflux pump
MKSSKVGNAFDIGLMARVFEYTKPHKKSFYLTAFLTISLAFLSPLRPWLIQYTVDHYVLMPDLNMLAIMSLIMLVILIFETILQYYQTYLSGWLGQTVIRDIRKELFSHLTYFKMQYFDKTPIGTLVTRVVNDIETMAEIFAEGLLSIVGDLLKLFVVLGVMFWIDWKLTLVCLIPVPFLLLATWLFKNGIRKSFNEVRNEVANLNAFTQEHITGMSLVQAFNREEEELKRFKEINQRHRAAHIRSVWYYSVFFPVVEILSAISIALLVLWGTRDIIYSIVPSSTPGRIIEFILYTYMLYRPMRQLADRFNILQMGIVSAERIFGLLDAKDVKINDGTLEKEQISGDIRFEHVTFSYVNDQKVLTDFNIHIKPGEKIAIVGATGSGKTTIINLLSRLYELNEGRILVDGTDIREFTFNNLRKHIGVVLQDVFLFSNTVANNISLHHEDITREQIVEAAKAVGAHDFIMKLPGDYEYNVRERGVMLSVGQRQLISFIRAFVFNPNILILDEATSSIDTETEILIQKAIETITSGRTSIIIAHRLSTVKHVDRIVVMDHGKIIEEGSHAELMALNGQYKKLIDLQFAG